jgi:hypothetical protein
MKEYFKLTSRKILGVIILLFLFSFLSFFFQYVSNPVNYVTGQYSISIGLPLVYLSIGGKGIENFNTFNLLIDIIIFYLITCALAFVFKRRKENVPNSNSGGGNTSTSNQAQP